MFDAEKRALELALRGSERVARYVQKFAEDSIERVWYIHGGIAFKPIKDCIHPVLFSSNGEEFPNSWDKLVRLYMYYSHHFMTPQTPKINLKDKIIPMLSTGDDVTLLKHVFFADIKPWLNNKWRYVFVPEEYSWRGGVFLILPENSPDPMAFILPYSKDIIHD